MRAGDALATRLEPYSGQILNVAHMKELHSDAVNNLTAAEDVWGLLSKNESAPEKVSCICSGIGGLPKA